MERDSFAKEFQKLRDAFPTVRIAETVESSWFESLAKYGLMKVRYAFQEASNGERFPTLAAVVDLCKCAGNRDIQYVMVLDCCASSLPQHGRIRCGCRECQPEIYAAWANLYHNSYGKWPWDSTQSEVFSNTVEMLVKNPGGREGFEALLKALRSPSTRGFEHASSVVKRAVKDAPEGASDLMEGHSVKVAG